jgi:hypothetical protein
MRRANEPVEMKSVRWLWLSGMVLLVLLVALPAWAKIPPFTVSMDPEHPVVGETTTITAEFARSFPVDELSDVVSLSRTSADASKANVIPLTLERVTDVRYEARVIIPEAGTWALTPFPDRNGWAQADVPAGYPGVIEFEVTADGVGLVAAASESAMSVGPLALTAAFTAVAGLATIGLVAARRSLGQGAGERSA